MCNSLSLSLSTYIHTYIFTHIHTHICILVVKLTVLQSGIGMVPVDSKDWWTKLDSVARKTQKAVCTSTSSPWFSLIGRHMFILWNWWRRTPGFQALSHAPTPIPTRLLTDRKLAQSQSPPWHGRVDAHMVSYPTVEIYAPPLSRSSSNIRVCPFDVRILGPT